MPDDADTSAAGLLSPGNERLRRAQEAGGNRVIASDKAEPEFAFTPDYLFQPVEVLLSRPASVPMGALGLQLMPLIRALDKALAFGLPLDDMEQRFAQRAKTNRTIDRRPATDKEPWQTTSGGY